MSTKPETEGRIRDIHKFIFSLKQFAGKGKALTQLAKIISHIHYYKTSEKNMSLFLAEAEKIQEECLSIYDRKYGGNNDKTKNSKRV